MKKTLLLGAITVMAGSLLAATTPKEDVQSAVKKLADAGNYSWTTALDFGGAGFEIPH